MTVMKNAKNFIRAFATHALIFSLLQTCFVFSAYAQSTNNNNTSTAMQVLNVANQLVGTAGQAINQASSLQANINQQVANAALQQKLSPSCRKTDGTLCYSAAGSYFPECPLPATITAMPQNVCNQTLDNAQQSSAQISSMDNYEAIGKSWVNYYDQMLNEASNASVPTGLKCLNDKKKALDSQLTEMVNNLTRLQDQLKKDKETFKSNTQTLLNDLNTANETLNGASSNNLDLKTKSFASNFSTSCQTIIGDELLKQGNSIGLNGVKQNLTSTNKLAADYTSNRTAIENEVRSDITKIQASIKNGGLQDYLAGKTTTTSKFGSLVKATTTQKTDFNISYERIKKELDKVGYTIPALDKNFSADLSEATSKTSTTFKNSMISKCVSGSDSSGIAISTSDIIASVTQKGSNGKGAAVEKYKSALQIILNSTDSVSVKLQKINTLSSTYKDMVITYQNSSGQTVTQSPYNLIQTTYTKCEEIYEKGDINSSDTTTQKKQVERAQSLLRELQTLYDNYTSDLGTRVLEQFLSCNGDSKKAGSDCGTSKSFDYTDGSFCTSHADQCANEVSACYSKVSTLADAQVTKMKSLASTYNKQVESLITRANALYTSQNTAVTEMIKKVQARFPGTNFTIPEDMFISKPSKKTDKYGIEVYNDGDLSFLDELPTKIDKLKELFKEQQDKADSAIEDYISKQASQMDKERSKWQSFADQCNKMAQSVRNDLKKYNADGSKAQAQQDSKVGAFCSKYSEMKQNPLGACDKADKLAEQADEIRARLSNEALQITGQFKNVCNMYNNETDDATYADCLAVIDEKETSALKKKSCKAIMLKYETANGKSKTKSLKLSQLCKEDMSDKDFIAKAVKYLPEGEQDAYKKIESVDGLKTYLKTDKADDTTGAEFFGTILGLTKGNSSTICKRLTAINEATDDATDESIKAAQASLDKATKEVTDLETALAAKKAKNKDLTDPLKADAAKKEEKADVDAITAKKEANEKAQAKITEDKLNSALSSSKSKLKDALIIISPVAQDEKTLALQRLGQQDTQSCDSQATRTTTKSLTLPNDFSIIENALSGTGTKK
jgi:hypothetical protein